MAQTLQHLLDDQAPAQLAAMLGRAWRGFAAESFVRQATRGYKPLGLMARGTHLAQALHAHLPADFARAAQILVDSMGPPLALDAAGEPCRDGQAEPTHSSFLYLPYSVYIARHGLAHFDAAMAAQHALTQRFTAEFSLRPFLIHHQQATLARLSQWVGDPSAHVRRLISEGTRPRLPWAARCASLVRDPRPVLPLLESLKDDPSSYVRRSVANHLNDIGKDHPELVVALARRWADQAPPARTKLLHHALRTAVKRGDTAALQVLGLGHEAHLRVEAVTLAPRKPLIGGRLSLGFALHNDQAQTQQALVDLRVHYRKANGSASPKTFKLRTVALAPGASLSLSKQLSLAQMTTRTHYPGRHKLELLLNGRAHALGHFDLRAPTP